MEDLKEESKVKQTAIYLDPETKKSVKLVCAVENISMSKYIQEVIKKQVRIDLQKVSIN